MMNIMPRCLAISGQIILLALALMVLGAQEAQALNASQVYEQVKDSIVVVKSYDQAGKLVGLGSGVVLPSGEVVTNYHVFKSGVRHAVVREGKAVLAAVKAADPKKDLCLFSAPGLTATPARLGQASRLKVGEPVYAVGAPQGLELSLSEGIVSQLRGGQPPIIQTTVAISQGSSGGGLFNAEGELVGIMTFYVAGGQSLNFAVPVEWVKDIRPGLPDHEKRAAISWLEKAQSLDKMKDWRGLLALALQWAQSKPNNADPYIWLGIAYGELGRHKEEIEAYREALRLQPSLALAWSNLGVAYAALGNNSEALKAFKEALRFKPDNANTWYNLGGVFGKLLHYQDEIEAYNRALRLKPDFTEAWVNLAIAYSLSGNRSAALEAIKELRHYDPQKADKIFNLIMKP